MECKAGTCDVGNSIETAHFVEVNLLHSAPMHLGFRFRNRLIDGFCVADHFFRKICVVQDMADFRI